MYSAEMGEGPKRVQLLLTEGELLAIVMAMQTVTDKIIGLAHTRQAEGYRQEARVLLTASGANERLIKKLRAEQGRNA